ncbi:MAG: YggS family pyridoxal phosphate-dependent enzyme [Cellulosilyticaceae bacterium]
MEKRLQEIEQRIEKACNKIGKQRDEITLVAVSKTYSVEHIQKVMQKGVENFGENRVQELICKQEVLESQVKWHLIGHLQTNKVKYVVGTVDLIQSVDSIKLAEEIQNQSIKKECVTKILIQVNIAQELTKYGFIKKDVIEAVKKIAKLSNVKIEGLMMIAPYVENAEENRSIFKELYKLSVDIQKQKIDNVSMRFLSMGMSNDFEVAIEEGANMIRIGTAIFEQLNN